MKKRHFFTALLTSLMLSACATKNELAWLPYQEIDGSTQAISFMQVAEAWGQKTAKQGTALQREKFDNIDTYRKLGDIYYIYDVNEQPMRVILLNHTQSVDPHDPAGVNALGQSKVFDFYEFGKGRVGHAQFTANTALCSDFASKRGVDLRMVTNYYATENQYFTSLITGTLFQQQKPQNVGYKAAFFLSDKALEEKIRAEEREHGKRLAIANLMEKVGILSSIVCGKEKVR
ncbi:hypothetical protein [Conservatibacter flavescens]|uniref:DUF8095 domain-containing protein n=1 Tax=Conservatibacter flavescens TaxID=28161 RepID=A0A2M8RZB0_9PAST|nr:hypothetical protein [Conservatibacter flavescens]PJG84233.1 hypothetical protein CVP05_12375 [Conservatibacter flavescens]